MATFLGIDFGTTQTVVAMIKEGSEYEPEIVEIDGEKTVYTALRLDADDNVLLFGQKVMENIHEAPEDTFYNFKVAIGSGKIFRSSHKDYTPETLALLFLKHLRKRIEKQYFNVADLSQVPDLHCTIGCPAAWNEEHRRVLAEIAEQAGFPCVTCHDEPFGVIYYHYSVGDLNPNEAQNILVYDFGGGTTDIAIEEISPALDGAAMEEPRVLAATGMPDLGGKDFDERLRDYFLEKMGKTVNSVGEKDARTLEFYSKKFIKENLSDCIKNGENSVEKTIPMLASKRDSHKLALSQEEFEQIFNSFIARTEEPVYNALNIAGLEATQIHDVILAGGSSRLYYVENKVKALFSNSRVMMSDNPIEVIGKGLALYGEARHVKADVRKARQGIKKVSTGQSSDGNARDGAEHGQATSDLRKNKQWLAVAVLVVILAAGYWFFSQKNLSIPTQTTPSSSGQKTAQDNSRQEADDRLREKTFASCKSDFNNIKGAKGTESIPMLLKELNWFKEQWPSAPKVKEINQVISFLEAIQKRPTVTLKINDGDFRKLGALNSIRQLSSFLALDIFIQIQVDDRLLGETKPIKSNTRESFNADISFQWDPSMVITFLVKDKDFWGDDVLLTKKVDATGLFGYKNLNRWVAEGDNGFSISLEHNIPSCPW